MNNDLEHLKRDIPLLSLAESYGMEFKKIGVSEYACRCPYPGHEDVNPSFNISTAKNVFHCMGCGQKGSVIDLVMLKENVSTGEAIRLLKERYGLPKDRAKASAAVSLNAQQPADILPPNHQKLLKRVIETYHDNLKNTSRPVEYLLKRKIRAR